VTAVPTVEDPIINSAFEEPRFHWVIEKGQTPVKQPGRRPAGYYFRVPEGAARGQAKEVPKRRKSKKDVNREVFETDSPGELVELQAANQIREKLKVWRARGYDGATAITKELLALWSGDAEERRERLFFAQREAAEALIFMVEGPKDLVDAIAKLIPADEPGPAAKAQGYRAFQRYALKMATGTGKTTVMGMLAAWSILNALHRKDEDDERFSDTVLIVCPNVTIRDRLRELDPALGEQSLYAKRQLVPRPKLADLSRGDVIVTNWHNLALKEPDGVNGEKSRVDKRGVPVTKTVTKTIDGKKVEKKETQYFESDKAFVNRILKNRKGRSPSILVFNDEAHHAYRRNVPKTEEVTLDKEQAERNDREATIWIEGLDRINKALNKRKKGIRWCVDLSATPFHIQGSGNEVGKAFPWIISDFGLLDAIEAGMVKIPMLPSADTTGNDRSVYFNIWRWVQAQLEAEGVTGEPAAHHVLRYAVQPISLLTQQWEEKQREWAEEFAKGYRKTPAPPVFIIVCRDTRPRRCSSSSAATRRWRRRSMPGWRKARPIMAPAPPVSGTRPASR
jgi:type III restriction enzyme